MGREKGSSGTDFDRDFGYLMPFLDKVAAAASGVQAPGAREELTRLVAGEKERWQRIQALLKGAPAGAAVPPSARSGDLKGQPPPKEAAAEPMRATHGFTVGPLKRR